MTDQQLVEEQRTVATLDAAQVVALVERAGVHVDPLSPLAPLIAAGTRSGRAAITDVPSSIAAAVTALAAPTRQLRVLAPMAAESFVSYYYAGPGIDGFVGATVLDDRIEITSPWAPGDLAALGGSTLLDERIPAPSDLSVSLSPAAITALAATIDAVNQTYLQALLARTPASRVAFDKTQIQQLLHFGTTNNDARWAVTLFNVVCPPIARLDPEDLESGLAELVNDGLLHTSGSSWEPSALLLRLAADWRPGLPAISHETIRRGSDGLDYRYQIAIRGNGPLYVLDYFADQTGRTLVHLHGMTGLAWLESVTHLLSDR